MIRFIAIFVTLVGLLAAGEAPAPPAVIATADLVATIDGEAIHLNELTVGPLVLGDVAAKLALKERVLTFNDCQASLYGGEARGTIVMDFATNRTHVIATVAGVDLASLLASMGSTNDSYTGRVDGRIDLSFPTGDVRKAEGRGHLTIKDANLVEMSFFTNLLVGNVGNVRGQDSASVTAEIRDGEIRLNSARITIPKGSVLVTGIVALDGGLRLLVVPKLGGGALSEVWFVGKWFGTALALASSRVARMVVRGTISKPVVVLNPFASE
ncbi:MAG TPA: AsmA-like C-terminal region-containing protein [Planctomycetota bacterium]|nr:AsmA-like C-terminal region-containing protein [Planctomycetota bacterium]